MRRLVAITIIILATLQLALPQVPQGFTYQGVAHDYQGRPVANKTITVEITILQGNDCNSGCQTIWQELHFPTTNDLGVFTIEIGSGQSTHAGTATNFSDIPWSDRSQGDYFLRVRIDFGQSEYGNAMLDLGTTKILSVPYALVSEQASNLVRNSEGKVQLNLTDLQDVGVSALDSNQMLVWDGNKWINLQAPIGAATELNELSDVAITSPQNLQALMFNASTNKWTNTTVLLNSLNDVSILSPSANQVLSFDGTNWINQNLSLSSLADVNISSPNANQALIFDGSQWTNSKLLWQKSDQAIYLDTSWANKLPLLIGIQAPEENANFYDSVGKGDFVIEGIGSYSTEPALYPGKSMVFYGDFASLIIGPSNINTTDGTLGAYSMIVGQNNDYRGGSNTLIFGNNNTLERYGFYFPNHAFVFGNYNQLNSYGEYNFVFGKNNDLINKFNFVFGINNYSWSLIGGDSVRAFIVGDDNRNYAKYSITLGKGLTNKSYHALIIGQYNLATDTTRTESWNDADPIFVIGNGTSDANRSNALVILKNGNIYTKGTVYESYTGDLPSKVLPNDITDRLAKIKVGLTNGQYVIDINSLREQFPNLVREFDSKPVINTTALIPILIHTIQQQQKQLEQYKEKINDLEQRLERLEKLAEKLDK